VTRSSNDHWNLSPQAAAPSLPGWPVFDEEQRAAVDAVLASGRVNQWTGSEVRQFESEYAAALGVPHAIAVANGTVAIEFALRALNIRPGHEVIVPSRTFLATASAVAMCGATPIFADVDGVSGNVTASAIEPLITPRTRAIIVVHVAGWPCEMDAIADLARRRRIPLIEDCAQAHGALYRGKPVGTLGDIGCFSFCQDKILTTGGEGGLIVTHREDLWKRAWSAKDHGKSWDAVHHREHPTLFKWLHESLGTNGRLTEMQAAIGRVQLRLLPKWVEARRRNASILDRELADIPGLRLVEPPDHVHHSFYKYYAFVDHADLPSEWTRDRIAAAIQKRGVPCGPGSCGEIYRELAMKPFMPKHSRLVSQRLGETSLMFQVHPTLEVPHMELIAANIRAVFEQAVSRSASVAA
jgi:dTDP-4-amino-4,6-dideoxygalactose transaminase